MKNIKSKTKAFSLIALATVAVSAMSGAAIFANKNVDAIEANAWSGKQTPNYSAHFYDTCEGKTGSALKSAVTELQHGANKPKSPSYDWDRYERADEVQGDSSSVWCIYTTRPIKKSNHCGNYSWNAWNREHVYPQGKYPRSNKDNHNIFACEGLINNYRSSLPFGNASKKNGERKSVHGHMTDCYIGGGYFEPPKSSKGDIARSLMYTTLTYDYNIKEIIESTDVLLEWHTLDPVDDRDIYRNNTVQSMQGNRNPFVDHPEWAYQIWGNGNVPDVDVPTPNPDDTETSETTKPSESTESSESTEQVELPLETITLNKNNLSIRVGDEEKLTVKVTPSSASKDVVFTSSDRRVVDVDNNGSLKALKTGEATITATSVKYSNISATCKVKVNVGLPTKAGFEKLTSSKADYSGEYIIGYTSGDGFEAMSNSKTSKINLVHLNVSKGMINDGTNSIKLEKDGDKYYIVNPMGKCLTSESTNSGNKWGEKNIKSAFKITCKDQKFTFENGIGNFLCANKSASRILCYGHEIDPLELYVKTGDKPGASELPAAKYDLDAFYGDFMSLVTCDGGVTAPSKQEWGKVKALYESLSSQEKSKLKTLATSDAKYGKLVERYDYIIRKYGVHDYENFIGRTIAEESIKTPNEKFEISKKDIMIIVGTGSGIAALTIVTIYLVLKRRQKRA